MRILNVSISEKEFNKFGLKKDKLSFTDFFDLVSEMMPQNLDKRFEFVDKYGLSQMTMDENSNEVKNI